MILYALKSAEGYLKMAENKEFALVGINKASVYPESELAMLKVLKTELQEQLSSLRIIKITLAETDHFA
ncbi:MAG: hypothetical protein CVU99_09320 [Firmicutes bacterium HGW-Firmicutes-4]|jgi:hypothetical protein|nr:MAG: hypothetical protein CVU99_09320 [Firmicutes bacterium HGW-Firmicutes-4]